MTPATLRELAAIKDKLYLLQTEHDTRLLAPALMNCAVYLYRLLVRSGLESPQTLETIMKTFTEQALAPNTDPVPKIVTTGNITKN